MPGRRTLTQDAVLSTSELPFLQLMCVPEAETPVHADGDVAAPEKPRAKQAAARPVGREVYAAGGRLSKEHLHQKGLSDAEFEFKQKVYDAATARLGDKIYGGVAAADLVVVEGKQVRKDIAGDLASMLSAMRGALAAGQAVGKVPVGHATGIHVTSGYRSPERDRDLWDGYFQSYFHETAVQREATGDPLGAAAVQLMVKYLGKRKAAPGGSNHSNGTAVDLQIELGGHRVPNKFGDQAAWRASWQHAWLEANAKQFHFHPYSREAWHWDHRVAEK